MGERIGNINTGLTEEIIVRHLKTRIYLVESSAEQKRSPCVNQENNFCIICQVLLTTIFQLKGKFVMSILSYAIGLFRYKIVMK